jgi:hypothetical protein
MKDIQKIKKFFSKPLEEDFGQALFNRLKPEDSDLEVIVNTLKQDPKIANSPNQASFKEALERYIRFSSDKNPIGQAAVRALEYRNTGSRYGSGFDRIFNMLVDKRESTLNEGNKEYFKPSIRKDKSNPNFLFVDIAYPEGSDVLSVGGSKTMGGQDRESGAAKALSMGNTIVKKLEAKYNIEDIEVKDLKNGKVEVFAVSDDFTKMASPSLDEAKKENEYPIVIAKKATEYGWKPKYYVVGEYNNDSYILIPIDRFNEWEKTNLNKKPGFNKYEEIVSKSEMENLMNEAKKETAVDMAKKQLDALGVKYELGNEFKPFKVIYKPTGQSDKFYDTFEDIVDLFNLKGVVKSSMNEAKEEDKVDTITMDVPLFIRMLEYSREDAAADVDLHDVTEKANKLGKERGILQMDDYDEIVGAAEKVNEVNLKQAKLSSAEYQKAKKLKDFKASDWKWNADEDLYTKVIKEGELTEAYVPSNIKEFAKRKGVSSLVNKVAGWAEKVGKGIRGGTAIGYNYSTLVLDMTYQGSEIRINTDNDTVTLYDEPVNSFPEFKSVYLDNKEEDNGLAEKIAEALDKINEELCPAGKAYIKRRQAAGEKSSAYLSGRGVKVCKGQMSGKAKKKK